MLRDCISTVNMTHTYNTVSYFDLERNKERGIFFSFCHYVYTSVLVSCQDVHTANITISRHSYFVRSAHKPMLIPAFGATTPVGVFLLPPGWDASPLQGYPQN